MRFIVKRTSQYDDEVAPCEEAVKQPYITIDRRSTDDPAKIPVSRGDGSWWYKEGRNHRVEDGMIARDFDDQKWFVEFSSFDELFGFIKKHGSVVVDPPDSNGIAEIEIYDYYRE